MKETQQVKGQVGASPVHILFVIIQLNFLWWRLMYQGVDKPLEPGTLWVRESPGEVATDWTFVSHMTPEGSRMNIWDGKCVCVFRVSVWIILMLIIF